MQETRLKFFLSISIAGILSLPSLFGWFMTPESFLYTGVRLWTPGDIFVYYTYLAQVLNGAFFFTNMYSIEPSLPVFNVFWLTSGLIGALFHLTPEITFALLRFVLGVGLLVFVYFLVGRFVSYGRTYLSFLFIALSSGVGAYFYIYQPTFGELNTPMDLWVPDISLPLTLVHSPHTIFSTILLFFELYFGYRAITAKSYRLALIVGLSTLFHFQFHPYYIPLIFGVLGVYSIILFFRNKFLSPLSHFGPFVTIVVCSVPSIFYHAYYLFHDHVTLSRAQDNILLLPMFHLTIISFGFLLPLALFGVYDLFKKRDFSAKNIFLITWFFVQSVLIITPISFQRKLLMGFWFVLGVFAWRGFLVIIKYLQNIRRLQFLFTSPVISLFLFSVMFLPTTYFNISQEFTLYNDPPTMRIHKTFYISQDEHDAFMWFQKMTRKDVVVLSSPTSGLFITAYANRRVYLGHWSETIYSHQEKGPLVDIFFFSDVSEDWRKKFLRQNSIAYLWWGPREKKSPFDPTFRSYLIPEFESEDVTIYRVQ